MKIYQELSRKMKLVNHPKYGNKTIEEIETIMEEYLPNGSGFNVGCELDFERSSSNKLIIKAPYQCMDENGFYDIWIYPEIIVTPSLSLEFDLKINWKGYKGKYKSLLNESFCEEFCYALNKEID